MSGWASKHVCFLAVRYSCSKMKSAVQAHGYRFGDIPNMHQLHADVWRTLAVARPAQVVAWLPVAAAPGGRAPPPPEPALPWGFRKMWLNVHSMEKAGLTKHPGTTGDSGGSDDQEHRQPTQQRSSLQQARDHLGNTGAYGFPEDFLPHEPRPDPTALGVWLVPYCMCVEHSGENCTVHTNEAGDDIIMMCNDCIHALECGRIPEAALARYDGGDVLEINQDGQCLEWPTVLEANILGLGHVQQQIYTLNVKNRPPDLQPIAITMHGIAMANPSLDQWVDAIPRSAASLPENITVLRMDVVSSKEELLEKLKSTKVLSVRAANIVAWVNYLSNLTSERHIDDQAMQEWQAMDPEYHDPRPEALVATVTAAPSAQADNTLEDAGLEELEVLVLVVPDTPVPGSGDDARNPVELHRELTAERRLVFASGGRASKILDYSREDVLASNFPTAFPYTEGGLRPLGMSNRTFFQHVSMRRSPWTKCGPCLRGPTGRPPAIRAPQPDGSMPAPVYDFTIVAHGKPRGTGSEATDTFTPEVCLEHCTQHLVVGVVGSCTHTHSDTCKRFSCAGVDGDCSMAYPHHIQREFKWVGDSGLFVLPRYGPNIVPHCPTVTMALGCNNVFMLACKLGRQYTATVEEQLVLLVPMCDPEVLEDILVQAEVVARRTTHHATKYVAKATLQSQVTRLNRLLVVETLHKGIGNLISTANRTTASLTIGMAMASFKLAGHETFETTYKNTFLSTGLFMAIVLRDDHDDINSLEAAAETLLVFHNDNPEQPGAAVMALTHYRQRGSELDGIECSLFILAMTYTVTTQMPI
ncbi:hypothetical protein VOLCADRAFT_94978 [Volvox carteri f. nagariensis]|uniref:DUF6570 domain-containing protein n=1 Tax=Volvox carteri f. nagariensis TaxID=3068 RepID=D8U6A1_VOLCA|nr:uncharacterized protein VOLCADRAFT_94978 [Volvox carteri f. nagariensis]EFJ44611.1 hypothetical protein VOLCADRAFT_94978 [Volvox carteri f. nagariensis]|eukprot:XP_002954187.1 hypothetical protein VOLCADRAFT_94978 [Volvox carteri f. nagariensis]